MISELQHLLVIPDFYIEAPESDLLLHFVRHKSVRRGNIFHRSVRMRDK